MAKMDMDKKNINRLYDLYYKSMSNIRQIITEILTSMKVMKKSDYDKNENGIVDNSEKVVLTSYDPQISETTLRFGVTVDGKYGYIKEGADTVTPFKSGDTPTGNKDLGTITANGTYTGYDVSDYATASVVVQVPGSVPTGNKDLGTITANGTYTGYDVSDYATASVVVQVPTANLQSKVQNISFSTSSWSAQYTAYTTISPDSGYDGMNQVQVREEFLRDTQLITATGVVTPSTYYNGNTAVSNSAKMLNVRPSKTGHAETSNDWVVEANSYFGNATAADVASGKTFSSSSGIQVTGTATPASLQTKYADITPGANWSSQYTNYDTILPDGGYSGMSQVQARISMLRDGTLMEATAVSTPSTVYSGDTAETNSDKCLRMRPSKDGMSYTGSYLYLQPNSYLGTASPSDVKAGKTFSSGYGIQQTGTNSDTPQDQKVITLSLNLNHLITMQGWSINPDSGYNSMKNVTALNGAQRIWHGTGSSTGAFTANLDLPYTDFDLILIQYRPHGNASPFDDVMFYDIFPVEVITKFNNTSTSKFLIGGRAVQSTSATSGSVYVRLFRFTSTNALYFHNAQQVNGTGSSNNAIIPYNIYGIGSLS